MTDIEDKIIKLDDEIRAFVDDYHQWIDKHDIRHVRLQKMVNGEILGFHQCISPYELESGGRDVYYWFLEETLYAFKGFIENHVEAMRE